MNRLKSKEYESLITMHQVVQDSDWSPRLLKLKKWDKIRVSYTAWNKQQNIKIVRL